MKSLKRTICGVLVAASSVSLAFCREALKPDMVKIPGKNYEMMSTEVTQGLYKSIMGENPSRFKNTDSYPVESVSWYDAIYFCNKLSEKFGLEPVYSVNGSTDVTKWGYTPQYWNNWNKIFGEIIQNTRANGYRLPTGEEWDYATWGGQHFQYSGSSNLSKVGWYDENSEDMTHPVAQKAPNGYGLYDMSGNVWEWCWDIYKDYSDGRCLRGGSWSDDSDYCRVDARGRDSAYNRSNYGGFRLARTAE